MNNSYISPFAKPVYVMLKPVGSVCNLACEYCYYLEKRCIRSKESHQESNCWKNSSKIGCQTMPQVLFTWHGGGTMRPISFYLTLELRQKAGRGRSE